MDRAETRFPNRLNPIYDVSYPVLGIQPAYGVGADPARYIIVVACNAMKPNPVEELTVGVIPAARFTANVAHAAKAGQYKYLLAECQ